MEKQKSLKIWLELIWWIVTGLIAVLVLFPIYQSTVDYPFWIRNLVFIIASITLTRYIFFTKFTFLATRKYLKVVLIFLSVPLIFMLIDNLIGFQTHLDEIGMEEELRNLPFDEKEPMINYIRNQMIFFGTAATISMIVFPMKMLISIWRNFNS